MITPVRVPRLPLVHAELQFRLLQRTLLISHDILYDVMRLVLDTNIVVSGLRSPNGASARLLDCALQDYFTLLLSLPLALEYESVCLRREQWEKMGLSPASVQNVINVLCQKAEPVEFSFNWRPLLRDPADEMVLETAINGQANALITYNVKDFGIIPEQFGIAMCSPQQALRSIFP